MDNAIVPCQVCKLPAIRKIRYGAFVCDACKKFFMRNCSKSLDKMRCSSRNFDCIVDATSRAQISSRGILLRFLCPYCRLAKCYSIGMSAQKSHSNLISETSGTSTQALSNKRSDDDDSPTQSDDAGMPGPQVASPIRHHRLHHHHHHRHHHHHPHQQTSSQDLFNVLSQFLHFAALLQQQQQAGNYSNSVMDHTWLQSEN